MEINNNKTAKIRELGKVDINSLCFKLEQLTSLDWDTQEDNEANYNKRPNSVLNQTSHIVFRFSNKQSDPFTYHSFSRWENWKEVIEPLMGQATVAYNYQKGVYTRVMLAKLPPKTFISPHTDGTATGSIPHKIHIPIETNNDSFFYLEGEKFHFKKGIAYEVNNSVMHSVVNNGLTNRIHLIFEYLDYDIQSSIIKGEIDKQL